jgi:superfamily II DNA or RNA helicase
MNLVAFLGTDKENWGQITALINRMEDCEKVLLFKNKNSEAFPETENCHIIEIDSSIPLMDMQQKMLEKVKHYLREDFEVAISLASGSGKEHMALISAILLAPMGIRLVAFTKAGIQFLT